MGLNFDFLALNLVGFFCYSVYNIALYSWRDVQDGYRKAHPHGVIPVLSNDVVFGLHGFVATLVTIIQCLLFEVNELDRHCFFTLCFSFSGHINVFPT